MTKRNAWYIREWLGYWENRSTSSRWHKGRIAHQQRRVQDVVLLPGHFSARVSDGEEYRSQINCQTISEEQKKQIRDDFLQEPSLILEMLQFELTPERVKPYALSLGFIVPEMAMTCSCQEPELPCKHLIAAVFAAAGRFSEDPALYLRFMGVGWEDIVAEWGQRAAPPPYAWPDEKFGYVPFPSKVQKEERRNGKGTPPFWTSPFPFQLIMDEIYFKVGESEEQ